MIRRSSRERRVQFVESFGARTLLDAVRDIVIRDGADFFTDEQIEQITTKVVDDALLSHRHMIRNRAQRSVRFLQAAE